MSPSLDPGREARLKLAFYDAWDARHGDPAEYRRRIAHMVDLYGRLHAEQLAELGHLPRDIDGCIAVLHLAARIVDELGGVDA